MLTVLQRLEPIASAGGAERYSELARGLSASSDTLAAFFDGDGSVMVMAEEAAVRRNRLNLLGLLRNQASVLADFSRIES
jgi:glycyl-tRNA synthetase beta chain